MSDQPRSLVGRLAGRFPRAAFVEALGQAGVAATAQEHDHADLADRLPDRTSHCRGDLLSQSADLCGSDEDLTAEHRDHRRQHTERH